jgi:hypothetical protein
LPLPWIKTFLELVGSLRTQLLFKSLKLLAVENLKFG